ncbi:alpha/beta hydrolase [Caballeronia sp. LZ034LL]|uniref:RBBP9/YdeN family alpha/beta hydrolase n=1 Tax=Caballeronia sp. LZ034LL TaxID=3038567 RepID=UPI00285532A1|nr:alpha/beta hydrolase [Caballeronia sp. LZ034LL]MDR5835997.1 alpha/beta hydrolase [Caballeronia sp. LZ034LL]
MTERSAWRVAERDDATASPVTLITVPGLHGGEGAHWLTWLARQMPGAQRVEQQDWDAPHLQTWSDAVRDVLADVNGPVVLATHGFGSLAAAHALAHQAHPARGAFRPLDATVLGVLFVAPASPARSRFAGVFDARRLEVPSLVVGSTTDPWLAIDEARALAQRWNSAFVNLGDAGHIDTSAGFGPWPLARHFVETLARRVCATCSNDEHADAQQPAYC